MNRNLKYKIGDLVIIKNKTRIYYNKIGKIIDIDYISNLGQEYFVEFFEKLEIYWKDGKTSCFGNNVNNKEGYCAWVFEKDIKLYISPLKKFLETKKKPS